MKSIEEQLLRAMKYLQEEMRKSDERLKESMRMKSFDVRKMVKETKDKK